VGVAGAGGVKGTAPTFQWSFNGSPLRDGRTADGALVSGAATDALRLDNLQAGEAGKYTVAVSADLDVNPAGTKAAAPTRVPVSAVSSAATLRIVSQ